MPIGGNCSMVHTVPFSIEQVFHLFILLYAVLYDYLQLVQETEFQMANISKYINDCGGITRDKKRCKISSDRNNGMMYHKYTLKLALMSWYNTLFGITIFMLELSVYYNTNAGVNGTVCVLLQTLVIALNRTKVYLYHNLYYYQGFLHNGSSCAEINNELQYLFGIHCWPFNVYQTCRSKYRDPVDESFSTLGKNLQISRLIQSHCHYLSYFKILFRELASLLMTNKFLDTTSNREENNSCNDDDSKRSDNGISPPNSEGDDTSSVSNTSLSSLESCKSSRGYEGSTEGIVDMRVLNTRSKKFYQLPPHRTEICGPQWFRIEGYRTKVEINYESIERQRYAASDTSSSYSYISLAFTHVTEQDSIGYKYPDGFGNAKPTTIARAEPQMSPQETSLATGEDKPE